MISNGKKHIDKNIIYIVSFILITVISLFYKLVLNGTVDKASAITVQTGMEESSVTAETYIQIQESEEEPYISVYICGAVNNPGVYEVVQGSIINDVVVLAGGVTDDASIERVNLVYILNSNISVYVPYENEEYEGNGIIRSQEQTMWGQDAPDSGISGSNTVNINSASESELITLPGIGEATARAIIEYREQTPFERIEDIMNVPGIGEAKFNSIRDLICV